MRILRIVLGILLLGIIAWPIAGAINTSVMSAEELAVRGRFWHWCMFMFVWVASIPTFAMLLMMVRQGHAQDDRAERGVEIEDSIGSPRA